MTLFTTHLFFFAELAAMRILMTIVATQSERPVTNEFCGRVRRFYWIHRCPRWRRALVRMAFAARHFLMRPHQLEAGRVVVKLVCTPTLVLVANFASAFLHAFRKLSGVGIGMAGGAALIRKNKKQFPGEWSRRLARVAIAARHRLVSSQQHKR